MKTDNEIEALLASGKKLPFALEEKNAIKGALLAYASSTLAQHKAIPSPWSLWIKRGSIAFASLLLTFIGTTYASINSVPGEPLYGVKIHVTEEMIALTKITPAEQVAYDIVLMEARLSELKKVAAAPEATDSELLTLLHEQIDEHTAEIIETVTALENDGAMQDTDKINTLSEVTSITKAQEKVIAQHKSLDELKEKMSDTKRKSLSALKIEVADFVETATEDEVIEYFNDTLTQVSEDVLEIEGTNSVQVATEMKLHVADEALYDGAVDDALVSILEAQQEIDAEAYLDEIIEIDTGSEEIPE